MTIRRGLVVGSVLLATASLSAQWSTDRTPPTVRLSAPAAGATVSGSVTLVASATDNMRVAGVQFYVDNTTVGYEDRYAPYQVAWDSTKVANGTHTIRARARDYSGNTASTSVTVTVKNGTAPPPSCTLALTASVPATALPGAAVSFSATGTPSNCSSSTVAYTWTFGDGATATTRTASHTYAAAGSYAWSVRATVAGVTATRTGTIVVATSAPCALAVSATVPSAAGVNTAVSFTAKATPTNCTGTVAYAWTFGDGGTAASASASHAYGSAGTYGWSVTASIGNVTATTSGGITISAENLLFYDDFTSGVDTVAWNVRNGPGDSSNSELQYYLPSNVSTTADGLQILTRQQSQSGYQYTSGMLYWRTFNFTYGTVEIRAKMAGGQGPWPALWLLGYMCQPGLSCNWPQPGSDEIDMTEILGSNHTRVNQQIHSGGNNAGCSATATDVSTNWHVYKMIWSAGRLVWQIDGVTTCTVTSGVPSTPMFLIINTAVGGAGGSVNAATLPQTMLIDYVKVTK